MLLLFQKGLLDLRKSITSGMLVLRMWIRWMNFLRRLLKGGKRG